MRRATSFLYGWGEFGISALETFLRLQLIVYYAKNFNLRMEWAALAVTLSVLCEAIFDPLIGRFSDRWREKTGSRVPLLLLGAALTAVFVLILFHPPQLLTSELSQAMFLFLLSASVQLSLSLLSVPYAAMIGDFTGVPAERGPFIGWRSVFANLGTLAGILVPGIYLMSGDTAAYQQSSWVLAIVILAAVFVATLKTPAKAAAAEIPAVQPSTSALKHRSFLWLLLFSVFAVLGLTVSVSSLLYFCRIRLELGEKDIQNVLLTYYFVSSFAVPIWISLGSQWGRRKILRWGLFLLAAHALLVVPFLPVNNLALIFIGVGLVGGFTAGSYALAELVLTDIIDQVASPANESRFGLYFGFWKLANKFSKTIGLVFISYALTWANVSFPFPETADKLMLIQGPVVAGLCLLAWGTSFFFGSDVLKSQH